MAVSKNVTLCPTQACSTHVKRIRPSGSAFSIHNSEPSESRSCRGFTEQRAHGHARELSKRRLRTVLLYLTRVPHTWNGYLIATNVLVQLRVPRVEDSPHVLVVRERLVVLLFARRRRVG